MTDLQASSLNGTSVLISWREPASPNGNILSYSVNITDLRDNSSIRRENRGPADTNLTETNLGTQQNCHKQVYFIVCTLEAGVPYTIRIAAVNRAGQGRDIGQSFFTRELSKFALVDICITKVKVPVRAYVDTVHACSFLNVNCAMLHFQLPMLLLRM